VVKLTNDKRKKNNEVGSPDDVNRREGHLGAVRMQRDKDSKTHIE